MFKSKPHNSKNFSYCFRVRNYDQYLHDVGELRAMGYNIDDRYNTLLIQGEPKFHTVWLHVEDNGDVRLHTHTVLSERVPNLEYIINEIPVIKSSNVA